MNAENTQHCKEAYMNLPEEKRERIFKVIKEEFAEYGFENTSVQQIASKSGISVGSVYKYFDNKEEMFTMVVEEGLSTLENFLLEVSDKDEDIVLKAEMIIRELLLFSRKQPEFIKLYCSIAAGGSSKFLASLSQNIEAISAELYTKAIKEAQKTGDVRSDIDPEFFAFLLDNIFVMLQYTTSCDYYKKRFSVYTGKNPQESDEFIVDQTLKFLKAAFNFK